MICAGFKRNGQPCCFKPKKGSSFCGHHQPKVPDIITRGVDPSLPVCSLLSTRLPLELLGEAQRLLDVYKIHLEIVPKKKQPWIGLWSYPNRQHNIQIVDTQIGVDFLETFVHEMAHAVKWDRYGRQGNAHGMQWKAVYHELMKPFLALRCWSPHEKEKLSKPGAKQRITLEDLRRENPGCQFLMEAKKGQQFQWQGNDYTIVRRTAAFYRCLDIKTGAMWKIFKRARVTLV